MKTSDTTSFDASVEATDSLLVNKQNPGVPKWHFLDESPVIGNVTIFQKKKGRRHYLIGETGSEEKVISRAAFLAIQKNQLKRCSEMKTSLETIKRESIQKRIEEFLSPARIFYFDGGEEKIDIEKCRSSITLQRSSFYLNGRLLAAGKKVYKYNLERIITEHDHWYYHKYLSRHLLFQEILQKARVPDGVALYSKCKINSKTDGKYKKYCVLDGKNGTQHKVLSEKTFKDEYGRASYNKLCYSDEKKYLPKDAKINNFLKNAECLYNNKTWNRIDKSTLTPEQIEIRHSRFFFSDSSNFFMLVPEESKIETKNDACSASKTNRKRKKIDNHGISKNENNENGDQLDIEMEEVSPQDTYQDISTNEGLQTQSTLAIDYLNDNSFIDFEDAELHGFFSNLQQSSTIQEEPTQETVLPPDSSTMTEEASLKKDSYFGSPSSPGFFLPSSPTNEDFNEFFKSLEDKNKLEF